MGWYPCTCCENCCKDTAHAFGCGCLCVGKNPCSTTLTITGNHPGSLSFPITYIRNPSSFPPQPDYCGLSGCSPINLANSTGHTYTRSWVEQERLWDKIKADYYFCCPEIDGSYTPYLSYKVEAKGVYVASRCYLAAIRYLNLDVRIEQAKRIIYDQEVCGVFVSVKLTYERFFDYAENRCVYAYGKKTYYEVPCAAIPGGTPPNQERACSNCMPSGGPFSPGADYSSEPYPSIPACPEPVWSEGNPDEIPGIPNGIYCIERAKFIPNITSVSCNSAPFTVALTPEDQLEVFLVNCCGKTRKFPSLTYYDYTDLMDYDCGGWTDCRGYHESVPGYGVWGPSGVYPGFGRLDGSSFTNCTSNVAPHNELVIGACGQYDITERDRGKNVVRPLANHTLLFGELNDIWNLNIQCSG